MHSCSTSLWGGNQVDGSPPVAIAVRRGRATIHAPNRLFSIFGVVYNEKLVGEFRSKERLSFDVFTDGLKFENDQGLEGKL